MSLFNLAHSMGNACHDIRNSLGVHMSPDGKPCSMYRNPDTGEVTHVIEHIVDGDEVELRAIGECPKAAVPSTQEVSR